MSDAPRLLDTSRFRAVSARTLLAIIGILYILVGLTLSPPYPLLAIVSPDFWRVAFVVAGVSTVAASTYPHPVPRWLSYLTFLLVTFTAGSRLLVLAVSLEWASPVWAWGIIVAWQLRDWLDVCRWR